MLNEIANDDVLYYREDDTDLIYEVMDLEDECLVRPATPFFYSQIERMSKAKLVRDFTLFEGTTQEVNEFYAGIIERINTGLLKVEGNC